METDEIRNLMCWSDCMDLSSLSKPQPLLLVLPQAEYHHHHRHHLTTSSTTGTTAASTINTTTTLTTITTATALRLTLPLMVWRARHMRCRRRRRHTKPADLCLHSRPRQLPPPRRRRSRPRRHSSGGLVGGDEAAATPSCADGGRGREVGDGAGEGGRRHPPA